MFENKKTQKATFPALLNNLTGINPELQLLGEDQPSGKRSSYFSAAAR